MEGFVLLTLYSFIIVYAAARLAIYQGAFRKEQTEDEKFYSMIDKLHKIKVITDEEHENIGRSYSIKSSESKMNKEYLNCIQVIKDLKEYGYLTEEEFSKKASKLKNYYKR